MSVVPVLQTLTAYLPEGVILAVVDPGVGTTEKRSPWKSLKVPSIRCPDNGLIAQLLRSPEAPSAISHHKPDIVLSGAVAPSMGASVFAPAAAYLAMAERSKTSAPNLTHRC